MSNQNEQISEHEAFKNRLVAEVLGSETAEKIPMEKVVMLIWQFRDDPNVVTYLARFVGKYAGSRRVFDGVEFYLPQLAHMIIHLEAEWDEAILERFALVIAQQSLHFALQFNWILQGAIEDYQPELPGGLPNPNYQPLYYARCIKLLGNLERCVVYGRPRSQHLQRMYEQGQITKDELHILESADRRFNAVQLTENDNNALGNSIHAGGMETVVDIHSETLNNPNTASGPFGGELLFKRQVRLGCLHRKGWKKRYFVVEGQMLNGYRNADDARRRRGLLRAMPLEGAQLEALAVGETDKEGLITIKYPHMIIISNRSHKFLVRASSEEDRTLWMRMLKQESAGNSLFSNPSSTDRGDGNKADDILEQRRQKVVGDLTPTQLDRYDFFRYERNFVQRLTDIAEELRFEERDSRKKMAPGLMEKLEIPPCVYLPLCNSSDTWRRICHTLHKDTRVFNTKERCPTVMYFLAKSGEEKSPTQRQLDVAEFMFQKFEDSGNDTIKEEEEENAKSKSKVDQEEKKQQEEMGDSFYSAKAEFEAEKKEVEEKLQPSPEVDENKEVTESDFEQVNSDDKNESSAKDTKKASASRVWHEDEVERRGSKDSKTPLQKRLRESIGNLPKKLANRMEKHRGQPSVLDLATDLQLVPILEGEADANQQKMDDAISIGDGTQYSVMDVDIDPECILRAKEIICGGELWEEKAVRMVRDATEDGTAEAPKTPGGKLEVRSLISKSNDDLRQEVFVMQMIHFYKSVFAKAHLPLWLKTYRILSTSATTGLLEVIVDATSIDGLKKSPGFPLEGGLRKYFENTYGTPDSKSFLAAQRNFMQSLAGYAIVSYLLGLKDRHNGNIMIDTRGHLINIDFGFAMGMAPGHEFSMERAAFKLTAEYIEVMGGYDSECYEEFKDLFVAGFLEARKNSQIALGLVEIMMFKSNYPCFTGSRYGNGVALNGFENRLMMHIPDDQVEKKILGLVTQSEEHTGTYLYDRFQLFSNGYAM